MSRILKRSAGEAFHDREAVHQNHAKRRNRKHKTRHDLPLKTSGQANPVENKDSEQLVISKPPQDPSGTNSSATEFTIGPNVERDSKSSSKKNLHGTKSNRSKEDENQESDLVVKRTGLQAPGPENSKGESHKQKTSLSRHKPSSGDDWNMSLPGGGRFLDQDPLLTRGGEYIILPTKLCIYIYSASTSILVRSIHIDSSDIFTSCVISTSNSEHILASTLSGSIYKWHLRTGRKICKWRSMLELVRIFTFPQSAAGGQERLLLLCSQPERLDELIICTLDAELDEIRGERTILTKKHILSSVSVLDNGKVLLVCAENKVFLGQSVTAIKDDESTPNDYVWRQITIPGGVASLDAREFQLQSSKKNKTRYAIDVALGLYDGEILIYQDLLFKLIEMEKGLSDVQISARRLPWHRSSVNSVKWSKDANYLVSGGNETVLVIWQLDTNQQQFLPHLSSPICNLTISASGSSYALRLADNSVMVLSTADLLPFVNISGVAAPTRKTTSACATLSSLHPTQLLVAIPTDAQRASKTVLQSFDFNTNHQIGRQALSRNMTTALRVSPSGQSVIEPDVTHLKTSHDGQWLVTVDEWHPGEDGLQALHPRSEDLATKSSRSEVCLRFWSWNNDVHTWELVVRVDEPHRFSGHLILDLAVNPSRLEVSTIGSDGCINIWRAMVRHRGNLPVQDKSGKQLTSWTCVHTVQPQADPPSSNNARSNGISAAICYSNDGSIIAASWTSSNPTTSSHPPPARITYLIDSRTGCIHSSRSNLLSNHHGAQLAFCGRYLLALSQSCIIYDIITPRIAFHLKLYGSLRDSTRDLLAVNISDDSFALALNSFTGKTQVAVFDAKNPNKGPLYQHSLPCQVSVLLPAVAGSGYVIFDADACVRTLRSGNAISTNVLRAVEGEKEEMKGLEDIFGKKLIGRARSEDEDIGPGARKYEAVLDTSNSSARSLDKILAAHSAHPRGVSDLFEEVASLFAKVTTSVH